MKRRLYFLLPNVNSAHSMMHDLLLARVNADTIHFVAKPGVSLGDLPKATVFERTDMFEGGEVGMALGALLGFLLGLLSLLVPTWWYTEPLPVIPILVICTITGLLVGGLMTGWMATTIPNTQLKQFEGALAQGKVLMIVLSPFHRVKEIRNRVLKGHPDVAYEGTWPTDHIIFP